LPKDRSGFSGKISDIECDPVSGEIFASREQSIYKYDPIKIEWIKVYDVYGRIESFSFDYNGNLFVACNMGVGLGMFFNKFSENTFRSTNSGTEEIAYIKDMVINSSGRPFTISKEGLFRLKD
jgi:hypothetical protein